MSEVDELREGLGTAFDALGERAARIAELEADNKRLREALEEIVANVREIAATHISQEPEIDPTVCQVLTFTPMQRAILSLCCLMSDEDAGATFARAAEMRKARDLAQAALGIDIEEFSSPKIIKSAIDAAIGAGDED